MKKRLFFSVLVGGMIASCFIGTSLSQEAKKVGGPAGLRQLQLSPNFNKVEKPRRAETAGAVADRAKKLATRQKLQNLFEGHQKQLLELSKTMTDRELEDLIRFMRRLAYDSERFDHSIRAPRR